MVIKLFASWNAKHLAHFHFHIGFPTYQALFNWWAVDGWQIDGFVKTKSEDFLYSMNFIDCAKLICHYGEINNVIDRQMLR